MFLNMDEKVILIDNTVRSKDNSNSKLSYCHQNNITKFIHFIVHFEITYSYCARIRKISDFIFENILKRVFQSML